MDKGAFKSLQEEMPFTNLWGCGYIEDPRPYKHLEHCLINIVSFAGQILARIERADHYGPEYSQAANKDADGEALAYIIMSALKAANKHHLGKIEIADYIETDLNRRKKELTNA